MEQTSNNWLPECYLIAAIALTLIYDSLIFSIWHPFIFQWLPACQSFPFSQCHPHFSLSISRSLSLSVTHSLAVSVIKASARLWMCSKWNCWSSSIRYLSELRSKASLLLNHISSIDFRVGVCGIFVSFTKWAFNSWPAAALLNVLL